MSGRYWSEDDLNAERFPLFVSVDGGHAATSLFAGALHHAAHVQVIHNLQDKGRCKPHEGYCNLSLHYQMLLELFFSCLKAPKLLLLEEDLEIAPDFFSYFTALSPLLDQDPTLWCISAWNDLGQKGRASNSTTLQRTDIMPGLGWMLPSAVGNELWPQWPDHYWDDWMRQPHIRKGRQCVFPEVSRTYTFGKEGTSGGILFSEHLSTMLLNDERVDWSEQVNIISVVTCICLLHTGSFRHTRTCQIHVTHWGAGEL
jgi:alpha-1,3-mannosyl-glycoprotein beta-1,2-N-acetylglucosaminyltransferase